MLSQQSVEDGVKGVFAVLAVGVAFSCTSSGGDEAGAGGSANQTGSGGAAASAGSAVAGRGGSGTAGKDAGGAGTAAGRKNGGEGGESGEGGASAAGAMAGRTAGGDAGEASAGQGGTPPELVPLPAGSRERAGVLNLVDADAAAELESFLEDDAAVEGSPLPAFNLFMEHYLEAYDFVYLFTDHRLDSLIAGRFADVNRRAAPGLGYSQQFDSYPTGYRTSGRTRGVLAIQYMPGSYGGPLVHELFHYWGTHYGYPFGYGLGDTEIHGAHWGYTGLKGVHGGFDASTLRCTTPEDEVPPNCAAETNGRYRYWIDLFFPNDNGVATPFSKLELYMMGLAPLAEVPESITLLNEATALYDTYVESTNSFIVEASGTTQLTRDDFVATYGTALELDEDERDFTAAFVVVSAAPVPDSVLDEVGKWAAIAGSRRDDAEVPSFEELTGGRATLDTELGLQRTVDQPPPAPWMPDPCDLEAQDCGEGRACFFGRRHNICGLSRGGVRDELCDEPSDCAPGLSCIESGTGGPSACEPYCNPDDGADDACSNLCNWFYLRDEDDAVVAGICQAP